MTMKMKMMIIVGWRVSGLDKQGLGGGYLFTEPPPHAASAQTS
jgi:hypothetical protein